MKKVNNLFLILTGFPRTDKDSRVDFQKLCDYVEDIGVLRYEDKLKILAIVTRHHSPQIREEGQYKEDVPFTGKYFDNLWDGLRGISHNPKNTPEDRWFLEDRPLPAEEKHQRALLGLIKYPRMLKHVIRKLDAAWESLHGNCDYMDLLDLTILKFSEEPFFDFIVENIFVLQRDNSVLLAEYDSDEEVKHVAIIPERDKIKRRKLIENDPVIKSWEGRKEKFAADNEFDKDDLDIILDMLFHGALISPANILRTPRTRSVFNRRPVDYFERIRTEYVPDDQNDQILFRAIYKWNNGDKDDLLDLILNGQFVEQVVIGHLQTHRWRNLAMAEHWQLVEAAIERLKARRRTEEDFDVDTALVNWIHFSLKNVYIGDTKKEYIAMALTQAVFHTAFSGEHFDNAIDLIQSEEFAETLTENFAKSAALENENKIFAYYAIMTLCFDDKGQEKEANGLFTEIFGENSGILMEQLSKCNLLPLLDEIYVINGEKVSGGLTQNNINQVQEAAKRYLSVHNRHEG